MYLGKADLVGLQHQLKLKWQGVDFVGIVRVFHCEKAQRVAGSKGRYNMAATDVLCGSVAGRKKGKVKNEGKSKNEK